ncbi:MAG: helix-hairpin-helix domain-containing protein [Candidatus Omnitrophota bacterium]|jgi:competence protein ComEA
MFGLTLEERRVILFFICAALTGAGISAALKLNSGIGQIVRVEESLGRLNLNLAGYEELSGVLGLSPGLASSIIAYRRDHGPFRELEELKNIKGIGEYRYEKLKGFFYVE